MLFGFQICSFVTLWLLLKTVLGQAGAAVVNFTSTDFEQQCLAFQPQQFVSNSTLTVLSYVAAGTTLVLSDNDSTCGRASQVVSEAICRIALSIPTSKRSSITFELWMPKLWNGRFIGTGNGGIDGWKCIKYEDLAYTSKHGFAAVGSNNGHNGTSGITFYNNPDIVEDFAQRSLHTSTTVGKSLLQSFYKRPHTKSYYIGCSLGGRQGIKASEIWPADFDGIVAGAPAVDFNNLNSWRASFLPITGVVGSTEFITPAKWALINAEILKQCDTLDGVADNIIEDPTMCKFKPERLACAAGITDSSQCLTPNQVSQCKKIYGSFVDNNGKVIFPGMQPGSELLALTRLYAGKPFTNSEDWFKYVLYDPTWDAKTFTVKDAAKLEALNPSDIQTYPSQLHSYRSRGGKMIVYHGQQDNQITSYNSIRFYDRLAAGMGTRDLNDFYRFFRISGMNHCNTGPGGWVFGQGGGAAQDGIAYDANHNVLAAIVQWVEKGEAPETIEGTKFVSDLPTQGVSFTRNHCRYPLRNIWSGYEWTCK